MKLRVPKGACDTHMHFYDEAVPAAPGTFLPGTFTVEDYRALQQRLGIEPVAPDHEAFRSLLRLVDTGRCWVKLSAPYETSKTGAPKYEDVGRLAKALVKHAPERMLWASNWPHPSARKPAPPKDEDLLELVERCAAAGKHILLEKPLEITLARAEALVGKASKVTLGVVLQHRFRPAAEKLHELVASGKLGRLISASASIPNWRPQNYYD